MSNRIKNAFDDIHAEQELKDSTRDFLQRKVYNVESKTKFNYRPLLTSFACLVLVLASVRVYFTPVAAISVDINPSLELEINRFDKVINVKGYNVDGENLAIDLELKHKSYTDAIDSILNCESVNQYIEDDLAAVDITVVSENIEDNATILETVTTQTAELSYVHCYETTKEEVEHAHEAGVSFGKYRLVKELQELDEQIEIEEVVEMTVKEIHQKIVEVHKEHDRNQHHNSDIDNKDNEELKENNSSNNPHDKHWNKHNEIREEIKNEIKEEIKDIINDIEVDVEEEFEKVIDDIEKNLENSEIEKEKIESYIKDVFTEIKNQKAELDGDWWQNKNEQSYDQDPNDYSKDSQDSDTQAGKGNEQSKEDNQKQSSSSRPKWPSNHQNNHH